MGCKESDVHYRTRSSRGAGSEGTPQAGGRRVQAAGEAISRVAMKLRGAISVPDMPAAIHSRIGDSPGHTIEAARTKVLILEKEVDPVRAPPEVGFIIEGNPQDRPGMSQLPLPELLQEGRKQE